MSTVGTILDTIRERRVRAGYREARIPREIAPPDLVEPCRRYPTAALLCFIAMAGAAIATIGLVILTIAAMSAAPPAGKGATGPGARPAFKTAPKGGPAETARRRVL